jgi:hypothetical protein
LKSTTLPAAYSYRNRERKVSDNLSLDEEKSGVDIVVSVPTAHRSQESAVSQHGN